MERVEKPLVYLDTHIVCWLYEGRSEKLSKKAAHVIESGILTISLIVDLELQYLDPFDRLITAEAMAVSDTFLTTRDSVIRENSDRAVRRIFYHNKEDLRNKGALFPLSAVQFLNFTPSSIPKSKAFLFMSRNPLGIRS